MRPQFITPSAPSWTCGRCQHELADLLRGGRVRLRRSVELVYVVPREAGMGIVCPSCSAPNVFPLPAAADEVEGEPEFGDFLHMMEGRWRQFRITQLRERGTLAVGLRFEVFKRDGFRCRYCGVSVEDGAILHVDHVKPESKGGPTTMENLVTACIDCNLGKSDKDLPA